MIGICGRMPHPLRNGCCCRCIGMQPTGHFFCFDPFEPILIFVKINKIENSFKIKKLVNENLKKYVHHIYIKIKILFIYNAIINSMVSRIHSSFNSMQLLT